jgi:hypothetical protein
MMVTRFGGEAPAARTERARGDRRQANENTDLGGPAPGRRLLQDVAPVAQVDGEAALRGLELHSEIVERPVNLSSWPISGV